jgi:hypothetical protein
MPLRHCCGVIDRAAGHLDRQIAPAGYSIWADRRPREVTRSCRRRLRQHYRGGHRSSLACQRVADGVEHLLDRGAVEEVARGLNTHRR